jgi:hypothetical protein
VSPPTAALVRGCWRILPPAEPGWAGNNDEALGTEAFAALDDLFMEERRSSALASRYEAAVDAQLDRCKMGL